MYVDVDGDKIDRMAGYVTRMDAAQMRDAIIPMTSDRTIRISYKSNDNPISSVSYEVTSPDTGKVVENAKIGNFKSDGDYQTASFSLTQPILMNREYPIRFTIESGSNHYYYYARVLQRSDLVTSKYVKFVYDFYEQCTNSQGSTELNSYLETDNTITNNSYTNVSIKSSLSQVTWGNLKPQIYRKAIPTIKEINGETCSLTADYVLKATNSDNETEYYRVHEFYRLRYYNAKMMMLDFQRDAEQVFDGNLKSSVTSSGINLGIAKTTLPVTTNEAGTIAAFDQDNDLWEYNKSSNKLARVFSFHDLSDDSDERDDNNDYAIHVIRVSESGDVDFAVYGYMSRGEHEGQVGVSLCHYNSESSIVTERAFLEYPRSGERLKADLQKLSYYSIKSDSCYFYLDRIVYKIDLSTGKTTKLLKDINPDCFVSSDSQGVIAYMPQMKADQSTSITMMNLENEKTRTIKAEKAKYLKVLGFLNDDLLYGIADVSDLRQLPAGNLIFAMKDIKIEDFNGKVIKDYSPDNYWVTKVTMTEGLAELSRVSKNSDGNYVTATDDNIMNNLRDNETSVAVSSSSTDRQGTIASIKFSTAVTNLSPLVTDFSIRYAEEKDRFSLSLPDTDSYPLYYVYAYGALQEVTTDPAQAVTDADGQVGVVLNQEGQYVYERGNKQTKTELNNEDIPKGILSGEINADKLQEKVGKNVDVMNLSGCTLDQVLYQVSQGRAVVTKLADGSTTVIVGYDGYNTLLYNFDTGKHYYMGINDSTKSMEAAGNVFVSYIERQATIKKR